jgi:hypothetical protein
VVICNSELPEKKLFAALDGRETSEQQVHCIEGVIDKRAKTIAFAIDIWKVPARSFCLTVFYARAAAGQEKHELAAYHRYLYEHLENYKPKKNRHTQATENSKDIVRQKASMRPPGERVTVDAPRFDKRTRHGPGPGLGTAPGPGPGKGRAICLEITCSETYDGIPTYPHLAEPYIQAKPLCIVCINTIRSFASDLVGTWRVSLLDQNSNNNETLGLRR